MSITSILDAARRLVTATPRSAYLDASVHDLALALHAVENDGRIGRFGAAYCRHVAKAERVVAWLDEHQELSA